MRGRMPQRYLTEDSRVFPGVKQVFNVPNPAAAAEWSTTVPGGEQWRIMCGNVTLTTSATVGTRLPNITLSVTGAQVWKSWDNSGLAASGAAVYTLAQAEPPTTGTHGNGLGLLFVPYIWLPDGTTIGSASSALQAGDQYSSINLYVERLYVSDAELTADEDLLHRAVLAEWAAAQQLQPVTG